MIYSISDEKDESKIIGNMTFYLAPKLEMDEETDNDLTKSNDDIVKESMNDPVKDSLH